jgi:prevent-host-death family protein
MQKQISATEAHRSFGRILRQVSAGTSFVVTSQGKPVARIEPVGSNARTREAAKISLLNRLESQSVQVIARRWKRDGLYKE